MSLKSTLLDTVYTTDYSLLIRLFHLYSPVSKFENVKDCFVNKDLNLLFIHNPRTAGTSFKKVLGLNDSDNVHLTPSFLISAKEWEKYTTVVSVRHPLDRLKSSFCYHTQESYRGFYFKKYPFIHQLKLPQYFELLKQEPFAIRPQVDYIKHHLSNQPVDYIIYFESLAEDMAHLRAQLKLPPFHIPHLNTSSYTDSIDQYLEDAHFKEMVIEYYHQDFEVLDYSTHLTHETI